MLRQYDDEHSIGGKGFTEEDEANFAGSFYSFTKAKVEAVGLQLKYTKRNPTYARIYIDDEVLL